MDSERFLDGHSGLLLRQNIDAFIKTKLDEFFNFDPNDEDFYQSNYDTASQDLDAYLTEFIDDMINVLLKENPSLFAKNFATINAITIDTESEFPLTLRSSLLTDTLNKIMASHSLDMKVKARILQDLVHERMLKQGFLVDNILKNGVDTNMIQTVAPSNYREVMEINTLPTLSQAQIEFSELVANKHCPLISVIHNDRLNKLKGKSMSVLYYNQMLTMQKCFQDNGSVVMKDTFVFRGIRLRSMEDLRTDVSQTVTFATWKLAKAYR